MFLHGRHQAIIWTNAGILLIRRLGTNFSEILSEIHTFSLKKMSLKMSSAKWRQFCLGLYADMQRHVTGPSYHSGMRTGHDDVIKWKHFPCYWPFVRGIHRSPVNSPPKCHPAVTRSFDVFFDLHPNKRLSKQWWGWWSETLSCLLWRHCNAYEFFQKIKECMSLSTEFWRRSIGLLHGNFKEVFLKN